MVDIVLRCMLRMQSYRLVVVSGFYISCEALFTSEVLASQRPEQANEQRANGVPAAWEEDLRNGTYWVLNWLLMMAFALAENG